METFFKHKNSLSLGIIHNTGKKIALMLLITLFCFLAVFSQERPKKSKPDEIPSHIIPGQQPVNLPFFDNMEGGAGEWISTGFWNLIINPSKVAVLYPTINPNLVTLPDQGNLPDAFSGSACWWYGEEKTGTFIGSDFDPNQTPKSGGTSVSSNTGDLISPAIDLTYVNHAILEFYSWWEIEGVDVNWYDMMYVEVTKDSGATWFPLGKGNINPVEDVDGEKWKPFSSAGLGKPGVWCKHRFDLSDFSGNNINIRFRFDTRDHLYNGFRGWLIDDFYVYEGIPPAPVIKQIVPSAGLPGDSISIIGDNFLNGAKVTIGSEINTATMSTELALINIPNIAEGEYDVTITNPDGQSHTVPKGFIVTDETPPKITSINPNSCQLGESCKVTITGENFKNGSTATLGGKEIISLQFVNSTSLTGYSPTLPLGYHSLMVINPSGLQDKLIGAFQVTGDEPPTVNITSPTDGATVSGTINIQAYASDDKDIKNVRFYIDDNYLGYDKVAPYSYDDLDTLAYQNGPHKLKAIAYDTSDQTTQSEITININNIGDSPPTVSITSPKNGAKITGNVTIEASASDDKGINKINFYIDNQLKTSDTISPYRYYWDTSNASQGSHSIKVIAYDTVGQTAEHQISVNVSYGEDNTKSKISGKIINGLTNQPIKGASIQIGSLPSVSSDSYGNYSISEITPGNYSLKITKSGYNALSSSISIPPSSNIIKNFSIYPITSKITINSLTSKYNGFVHYLAGTDFSVTYTANVDWGGHPAGKIRFITPHGNYDVSTNGTWASKQFNIALAFDPCTTLKAVGISTDGTMSEEKSADFTVMSPILGGLVFGAIDIGDGFYYKTKQGFNLKLIDEGIKEGIIPKDIPLFGSKGFNLRFIPTVKATVESSGTVEINLDWENKPIVKGKMAGFEYSLEPELKINGNFLHPSCTYKWSGYAGLKGKIGKSQSWPFLFMAGPIPIPMYAKATFDLSTDAAVGVENINPIALNGQIGINPYVRGSLGAGFDSILAVEGWLGGGADFELQWPQTPTLKDFTIYLNGGVTAYAFLWKWEKEFLKWDWNVYSSSKINIWSKVESPTRRKLLSRDYLKNRGQFRWRPRFSISKVYYKKKANIVATAPLQASTMPYSEPDLSSDGNKVSLIWVKDNEQRTAMNRTMATFSSYDGSNWSNPQSISDDGTADFHPQAITFSDGTVIAAWENEKIVMPDTVKFEDMVKNLEITASIYNPVSKTWQAYQNFTDNNYTDRSPRISGKTKDNVMLVWISNESNDLRGSTDKPNKIWYTNFDGTNWSIPQIAAEIPYGITKYDFIYDGYMGYVTLSLDTDGDQSTITDHDLFLLTYNYGFWENLRRLTQDNLTDDNPQATLDPKGNFILTWIKDGELSSSIDFDMTTRTIIMTDEYSTNLADFQLSSSIDGKISLIWAEPSSYSSDLYVVFYDPIYNSWGNPKQLTFDTETERNITAAFYGNDTIIAIYNRNEVGQTQIIRKAANDKLVTIDQPLIISTDLYMLKYTMGKDLALEDGSLISNPENPEPGTDVILYVKAMNLGDEPAINIPVIFYLENPSSGGTQIGKATIYDIFNPGDITEVSITWAVPETTSPLDIYAVIDPEAIFDPVNRANNIVKSQFVKPDLLIKSVNWIMTSEHSISLTARITNDGSISSGATTVKFKKDSIKGELLYEQNIASLGKYESIDANYIWDISGISSNSYTICIVVDEEDIVSESNEQNNEKELTIETEKAEKPEKDDLLGTWTAQGVYYRNSDDGTWVKMATPATQVAAGDIDGDGVDDLLGVWPAQGGVWVKYSSSGTWVRLSSTADWISAGDMNGDGRCDLLGTWSNQGVFYKDSATGTWVKMATPATQIAAGDIDRDGMDDLLGIWPSQGGVWVKYSSSSSWARLSSTAEWIGSGDMNGDGRCDLLGTWSNQGVFYKDSATGTWVKMATPATQIAAGDIDGDGADDLLGIWPAQGGVWVKYSSTSTWQRIASTADWIACGKMRGGVTSSLGVIELTAPIGGYGEGPGTISNYKDLSSKGPGGLNFVYQEEKNLIPQEKESAIRIKRVPGPGEYGFRCIEQKNIVPQQKQKPKT